VENTEEGEGVNEITEYSAYVQEKFDFGERPLTIDQWREFNRIMAEDAGESYPVWPDQDSDEAALEKAKRVTQDVLADIKAGQCVSDDMASDQCIHKDEVGVCHGYCARQSEEAWDAPVWKPLSQVTFKEYMELSWCAKDLDQAFAETRRR
jgi:hypothetical protein